MSLALSKVSPNANPMQSVNSSRSHGVVRTIGKMNVARFSEPKAFRAHVCISDYPKSSYKRSPSVKRYQLGKLSDNVFRRLLIAVVAGLWIVASAPSAFAQQDWIKSWAFNNRTEDQVKQRLTADYQRQIKSIDHLCELDETQLSKLTAAAKTDWSRYFREVSRIRRKLDTMELEAGRNQNINQAWTIVSPLQEKLRKGLFADGSLFQKVIQSTLSDEQRAIYEAELERLRRKRWRILTRVNVADIERTMPLLGDQRTKLLVLLDAEKLPIKMRTQYDAYAGFLKLTRLKNRKQRLAEFLDKQQIDVIEQHCQRYQGWEKRML